MLLHTPDSKPMLSDPTKTKRKFAAAAHIFALLIFDKVGSVSYSPRYPTSVSKRTMAMASFC